MEYNLFATHSVKVFCYNQQVADNLTASIRQSAQGARIPVVGVYETMPTPGYDYQKLDARRGCRDPGSGGRWPVDAEAAVRSP